MGELGSGAATNDKWDSLKIEHCSWALALPRTELQAVLTSTYVQSAEQVTKSQDLTMVFITRKRHFIVFQTTTTAQAASSGVQKFSHPHDNARITSKVPSNSNIRPTSLFL